MKSEWAEYALGELFEYRSGLSKPRSEFGSGYGFLSFKDVFYNYFVPDNLTELVRSTDKERETCSVRRGDVFLTRTSETMDELGMSSVALEDYEGVTFNGFCKRLRPRNGVAIDPKYAAFYFRSPRFRLAVTSMSSLSTRASLNNGMLDRLTMVLPPLEEQKRIAGVLWELTAKMELNRQMNQTLEAMAQAIFKSWFIDFDGHDDLVDSELGPIPRGWDVGSIYRIATVRYGAPFKSKLFNEDGIGTPLIRIRDLKTHEPCVATPETHPRGFLITRGDVVVGMDGEFRAHVWRGPDSWLNQRVCQFVPEACIGTAYLYLALRAPLAFFERAKTGTTVIHLGKKDIDTFRVVVPPPNVLARFRNLTEPLVKRMIVNERASRTLAALRDTLLPKLISGEIRVPEAEQAVEQVL